LAERGEGGGKDGKWKSTGLSHIHGNNVGNPNVKA